MKKLALVLLVVGVMVLGFGLLLPLKETHMTGRHRPAQLFRFDADKYERLKKKGLLFEL